MTTNKKIGVLGIIIVLAYFIYSAYIGINITSGFGIEETLGELQISVINSFMLALPALLLLFINNFKKNIESLAFVYIVSLIAGLSYLFLISTDALAGGMVMMLVEILALVISIVLLILKSKK